MGDKNNMKVKYMNECPNQKYYIEYLEGVGYDLKNIIRLGCNLYNHKTIDVKD